MKSFSVDILKTDCSELICAYLLYWYLTDLMHTAQINTLTDEENDIVMVSNGKQQLQKRRAVLGDVTNVSSGIDIHFTYFHLLSSVDI